MTDKRFNPMYIQPGAPIGKYVVRDQLGHGNGLVTYLADSPEGHKVVLKMSLYGRGDAEMSALRERFLRQVSYLVQLRETGGVADLLAHDWHPDLLNGHPYLVQEWVSGGTILEWACRPHPLGKIVRSWAVLATTCGDMGLRNICHRDLTPGNVLMTARGVPKIVDFSCSIDAAADPLTAAGAESIPGDCRYRSPEWCRAVLHERASGKLERYEYRPAEDLHALGALFYTILTGRPPFDILDESDESLHAIAYALPVPPSMLNGEVPFGLDKVTMKLLRKEPSKRYQSGIEVAEELETLLKQTAEDWDRPFQVPESNLDTPYVPDTSGGPRPPSTGEPRPPRPPTPTFNGSNGAAAHSISASVAWVEPGVIIPSPPPPSPLSPVLDVQAVPQHPVGQPGEAAGPRAGVRPLRRNSRGWVWPIAGAVVLAVTVGGGWRDGVRARGASVQEEAKAAVARVRAELGLGATVRAGDEAWLLECSPEARNAGRELALGDNALALLDDGANVITHDIGCEVRAGPVEVELSDPGATSGQGARLLGTISTGRDGASVRFDALKLGDGRQFPICAIAGEPGFPFGPGLEKVSKRARSRVPDSELHAGYTYVTTGALSIRFAQ